jgi:hypothetical protein
MVDTQQLQLVSPITRAVSSVAGRLAERSELVSPLQVVTYLPIDVDSVGRILETLEDAYDIERIERDKLCYFRVADPEALLEKGGEIDLETGVQFWDVEGLMDQLDELKADEDWARRVHEQHDVLAIVAQAEERVVDLAYLLSRSDIPSAKIQSILNDFEAEGYIEHQFEDDSDALEYEIPEIDYPRERHNRNLSILEELDGTRQRYRIWLIVGICVVVLLVVIVLLQI